MRLSLINSQTGWLSGALTILASIVTTPDVPGDLCYPVKD